MKLAFLGVGNMASAVISANGGNILQWSDILLYDKFGGKCAVFEKEGACIMSSVKEAVESSDAVFLAVKPQDYYTLLDEVKKADSFSEKLYISIGAGIASESIRSYLGCEKVVRALPNTPMLIGRGVSAVCRTDAVSPEEYDFVLSLFKNAGNVIEIDESEMNRIIGVTSSSPAYVFEFIESILRGAEAQGLQNPELLSIICDVVSGSAELLKSSKKNPSEMTAMVASKGGTTESALKVLREHNISETVEAAMLACTKIADELGTLK